MCAAITAQISKHGVTNSQQKGEACGPAALARSVGEHEGRGGVVMSREDKEGYHGGDQGDDGEDEDELAVVGEEAGAECIHGDGEPDDADIDEVQLPALGREGVPC